MFYGCKIAVKTCKFAFKRPKLLFKKYILPGASVGIWEISESLEKLKTSVDLDSEDHKKFTQIRNEEKKREWLAVRVLTQELTGKRSIKIVYSESGKPKLMNESQKFSISHTKRFAAVIVDSFETGIDIQYIDPKIERIAHKFMSDAELRSVNKENKIEQLSVYWCAKECLYKLHGIKNLEFKKELIIAPFNYAGSGSIKGKIMSGKQEQEYKLCYEKIADDTLLVYVLNT